MNTISALTALGLLSVTAPSSDARADAWLLDSQQPSLVSTNMSRTGADEDPNTEEQTVSEARLVRQRRMRGVPRISRTRCAFVTCETNRASDENTDPELLEAPEASGERG
jgi:hypothetical protein